MELWDYSSFINQPWGCFMTSMKLEYKSSVGHLLNIYELFICRIPNLMQMHNFQT